MKSIKEKAIEHNKKKNFVAVGDVPNEDFEAGANYVLEQIEDILANPLRYINTDKNLEEGVVEAIFKCIEQLKSNQ